MRVDCIGAAVERGMSDTFLLSVVDVFHFAAATPPSDFEVPKNTWGYLLPVLHPFEQLNLNQENQKDAKHRNDLLHKCIIRLIDI